MSTALKLQKPFLLFVLKNLKLVKVLDNNVYKKKYLFVFICFS